VTIICNYIAPTQIQQSHDNTELNWLLKRVITWDNNIQTSNALPPHPPTILIITRQNVFSLYGSWWSSDNIQLYTFAYVHELLNRLHEIHVNIRLHFRCENSRNKMCLTQNLKYSQPFRAPWDDRARCSHIDCYSFKLALQVFFSSLSRPVITSSSFVES
jgi:hypothetical protein